MDEKVLKQLFASVNEALMNADLSNVTADSTGDFADLPEGYFLSELNKAELVLSKNSGRPQAHLELKTVADGIGEEANAAGDATKVTLKNTKNRYIHLYYPLKADDDGVSIKRFKSDMMKFEDNPGHAVLPEEAWTRADVLAEALDLIASMKLRIYIKVSVSTKTAEDGTVSTSSWKNPVAWSRVDALQLPR